MSGGREAAVSVERARLSGQVVHGGVFCVQKAESVGMNRRLS